MTFFRAGLTFWLLVSTTVCADTVTFRDSDLGLNPVKSNVQIFNFTVELNLAVGPGLSYADPALNVRARLDLRGWLRARESISKPALVFRPLNKPI